jgi:hypothetical protein
MSKVTDEGFPKGRVAQTLRKILYPELTEHQVEAIVVCLMAHLLIENKLNGLIYRWLRQDAPGWKEDKKVSEAEDDLWKNIVKMDFARKYLLVEPFFGMHFSDEAANVKSTTSGTTYFMGEQLGMQNLRANLFQKRKRWKRFFLPPSSSP